LPFDLKRLGFKLPISSNPLPSGIHLQVLKSLLIGEKSPIPDQAIAVQTHPNELFAGHFGLFAGYQVVNNHLI
jgi:hypothetical protein